MVPIDFHSIEKEIVEVNGDQLLFFSRRNKFIQVWINLRVRK